MSCSNNAEYGSLESANKEAVVTNSDLIKQLMSYNDSILNTRPKTRGAKTFATVALNDVVGAYVGGKVGANIGSKVGTILGSPVQGCVFGAAVGAIGWGAWKSYRAYRRSHTCSYSIIVDNTFACVDKKFDANSVRTLSDTLTYEGVSLTKEEKNIGQAHNAVLDLALKNRKLGFTRAQQEELTNRTEEKEENSSMSVKMHNMCMSDEFIQSCTELNDSIINGKFSPNDKANLIVKLFNNAFETSTDNDDVNKHVTKYKTLITSSTELSDDEKGWICKALATAVYSYNYWKENNIDN